MDPTKRLEKSRWLAVLAAERGHVVNATTARGYEDLTDHHVMRTVGAATRHQPS